MTDQIDIFPKSPDFVQPRKPLIRSYIENQISYLKMLYPDEYVGNLRKLVEEIVKEKMKRPKCDVVVYPSHGECDMAHVDLGMLIKKHASDVITPCGTIFKSDPENIPPGVRYNNTCRLDRKKYKKKMFEYFEMGDMFNFKECDKQQNLKKIKNNSIIGAHKFSGSPIYDKESFGSITSIGRNAIIFTYTLTEQYLANNFYWISEEKILDYVVSTISYPDKEKEQEIRRVVDKYNLYIPDNSILVERLLQSSKYYQSKETRKHIYRKLESMLANISTEKKIYLFYRRNFINLLVYNDDLFRNLVESLCTIDKDMEAHPEAYQELFDSTQPEDVLSLPGDASMMAAVIYNHILDFNAVNKDLVKKHPDIAKKFAVIVKMALKQLAVHEEIFFPFMYSGELPCNVLENKNMLRKAVFVSDTDSILFTMKSIISWFMPGKMKITKKSIDMSAYTIYTLSRMLNVANRDLIISKGSVREHTERMNLKSEFFYSVFVKTDLGKHYFTKYLSKEGRIAKDPLLDVKGVAFQSSNLPEESKQFALKIMNIIIDDINEHGRVWAGDLVGMCIEYEKTIMKSLKDGDLYYYTNIPVKEKSQYTLPERSIYFNYVFWCEVFERTYGEIHLPGKYPVIPFQTKILMSDKYRDWLRNKNHGIHRKFVEFIGKLPPKKKISRVPISAELSKVPEELIPAIDMRTIIYKNLAPAQLALRQLGIIPGKQKQCPLFMDNYCGLTDNFLSFG